MTWQEFSARALVGCSLVPCEARAEALLDGEPLCLDCADLVIERLQAVSATPGLRNLLPALRDR